MVVQQDRWKQVKGIPLAQGAHSPDFTFCVMEMVAFVAGESWTDTPECASPVLTKYAQVINDTAPEDVRQRLKPFVLSLVGSRDENKEMARMFLLADRAVRVFAPLALEVAGLGSEADKLRSLPTIEDEHTAKSGVGAAHSAASAAARAAHSIVDSTADSSADSAIDKIWDEAFKALEDALNL